MSEELQHRDILFEVQTPLGFRVRTTCAYWRFIVTIKHPVMAGRESDVQDTLRHPAEVRQSRREPTVYLFYKPEHGKRWIGAVVKRLQEEGFLITASRTDVVKEGVRIWPR